jgi:hypothetical protein
VIDMLSGPAQPEMGRLRVADSVRRSEANRAAAALAGKRRAERRTRIVDAFASLMSGLRRRVERPAKVPQAIAARTPNG